jgi:hypothetical protein
MFYWNAILPILDRSISGGPIKIEKRQHSLKRASFLIWINWSANYCVKAIHNSNVCPRIPKRVLDREQEIRWRIFLRTWPGGRPVGPGLTARRGSNNLKPPQQVSWNRTTVVAYCWERDTIGALLMRIMGLLLNLFWRRIKHLDFNNNCRVPCSFLGCTFQVNVVLILRQCFCFVLP